MFTIVILHLFVNKDMLTVYFRGGSDINVVNKRPCNLVSECFQRISSDGYFVVGYPCNRIGVGGLNSIGVQDCDLVCGDG